MSDPGRIEKGDKVYVAFANGQFIEGIVAYIPCATGDSWRIMSDRDIGVRGKRGQLYYVQVFQYMTLLEKGSLEDKS